MISKPGDQLGLTSGEVDLAETNWGPKGEEQREGSHWVRKVVPVALWNLQFLECQWFILT